MPSPSADFRHWQQQFAAAIRDPAQAAPDTVPPERMAVYRELFFHNVSSFLADSFPVLSALLGEEAWQSLMQEYFQHHQAQTPLFPEMPQEFLRYLESTDQPLPPFTQELAHYEWVETALALSDAELPDTTALNSEQLLDTPLSLSPLALALHYRYPVHRIGADWQPTDTEPTALLVYRDRDDTVGFIVMNPVTARLVQLLEETAQQSPGDLLLVIAEELQHPQPEVVVEGGKAIITQLYNLAIVYPASY